MPDRIALLIRSPRTKISLVILVGLLISLLGYYLRLQQFSVYPTVEDTSDEYKAAFNGINLVTKGVPSSWSWFKNYKNEYILNIRGTEYRIVEPWFDEPPLFALMIGSYALSHNMSTFDQLDSRLLRYPMLKLGALNIFLLFLIIYFLKNPLEASVAALIYATVPTIVLGSRLPLSDNMVTTFALISLLSLIIYLKTRRLSILILGGVIGACAFLLKPTGIFVPAFMILLLGAFHKFKASLIIFFLTVIGIIIWFAYGYYYDWSLFIEITTKFPGRGLDQPTMIMNLFNLTRIGEGGRPFDGWLLWGWIAVLVYPFLFSSRNNSDKLSKLALPIAIGSYLIFFTIMSGHLKGWYRYPFYPFLAWASAALIIEIIKNPRFLTSFFFITLPVSSSYLTGTSFAKFNMTETKIYQMLTVAIMTPFISYEIFKKDWLKKIVQTLLILSFIIAIIFNIVTIMYYQDNFWYRW